MTRTERSPVFSAFSSATDSPDNAITAGTVELSDNDSGSALYGIAAAKPGDTLELRGPGGAYTPDPDADWHLMVGDPSVVPAISASLARVPEGRLVHVLLQGDGPEDEQPLAISTAAALIVRLMVRNRRDRVGLLMACLVRKVRSRSTGRGRSPW